MTRRKRMRRQSILILLLILPVVFCSHCGDKSNTKQTVTAILKNYPVNTMDQVIEGDHVSLDEFVSSDGGGSLRIDVRGDKSVRIYEVEDLNLSNAVLVYQARLKTKDLKGRTYLEMWCKFKDGGEFFSRDIPHAIGGTKNWSQFETPFFIKSKTLEMAKLNLVVEGTGTVWIDDIKLIKRGLP